MDTCAVRRVRIRIDGIEPVEGRGTVLLVTGDADLSAVAARALDAAGYRVTAGAHSGHAVLAAMSGERIDFLVTELAMDDVSGPALAARLRRRHPDLRTVYLAKPNTPDREGLLVRPFTRDHLIARLEAAAAAETV